MNGKKKKWFKRKTYGYGWTPATKEGWIVLLLYFVALSLIMFSVEIERGPQVLTRIVIPTLILTGLLIFVCYKKGEKPKWQWGERDE